jgi:hypothetical protein
MKPDNLRVTESDRFVADWIIEKINGLTDQQHAKLAGIRKPKEAAPALNPRTLLFSKRRGREK